MIHAFAFSFANGGASARLFGIVAIQGPFFMAPFFWRSLIRFDLREKRPFSASPHELEMIGHFEWPSMQNAVISRDFQWDVNSFKFH